MATTSVTACGAATTETTTNTAESSDNKETEDTTAESTESADDSDSSTDADKEDSDEEDVTYGEVKSVEDGKITIAVGTMKEMGGNGGAPGGDQGEAPEKPDGDGRGDAYEDQPARHRTGRTWRKDNRTCSQHQHIPDTYRRTSCGNQYLLSCQQTCGKRTVDLRKR